MYKVRQFKGLSNLLAFPMNSLRYNSQQKEIEYYQLDKLYRTWQNGSLIYSIPEAELLKLNEEISKYSEEEYIEWDNKDKMFQIE